MRFRLALPVLSLLMLVAADAPAQNIFDGQPTPPRAPKQQPQRPAQAPAAKPAPQKPLTMAELRKENETLRERVAQLEAQLAAALKGEAPPADVKAAPLFGSADALPEGYTKGLLVAVAGQESVAVGKTGEVAGREVKGEPKPVRTLSDVKPIGKRMFVHGYVNVPADGDYVVVVKGAGSLRIGERSARGSYTDKPILWSLSAGWHRLQLSVAENESGPVTLQWQLPDSTDLVPIPDEAFAYNDDTFKAATR